MNSNVLHYTFSETRLVYTCIIISDDWCKKMNIDYDSWRFHSFVENRRLIKLISELAETSLNSEDVLKTAKVNELLIRIMIELVENHCDINASTHPQSRTIEVVTSTIDYKIGRASCRERV